MKQNSLGRYTHNRATETKDRQRERERERDVEGYKRTQTDRMTKRQINYYLWLQKLFVEIKIKQIKKIWKLSEIACVKFFVAIFTFN